MPYFPVSLDLAGRLCIVIGGGKVAERKVRSLATCAARVQIISPELTPGLLELYNDGSIAWQKRSYLAGDLAGAFLVIAATDDVAVQKMVHAEAAERQLLLNVADVPDLCNFILPATARQGDLTVSVSTGGRSPALARVLRQELEKKIGPEYKVLVEILGIIRPFVLEAGRPQAENELLFNRLGHEEMAAWIRGRAWDKAESQLRAVFGSEIIDSCLEEIRVAYKK